MEILIGAVIAVILLIWAIFCYREVEKNRRNPLPKFENGDKRFREVTMYKTRDIK